MTQTGTNTVNPIMNVIGGDGITANADEIEVTVDGTTIELSASDGTGAVRAVTAAIAECGTGLATADQIYDHVTSRPLTSNAGTVTSVAVDGGTNLTDSGGPITSSGTITMNLDTGLTGMVSMAGVNGSGADQDGGDLTFSGGLSTGAGVGGDIFFKTSQVDADGAAVANTLETAMTIAAATSDGADTTVTIHGDLVVTPHPRCCSNSYWLRVDDSGCRRCCKQCWRIWSWTYRRHCRWYHRPRSPPVDGF